MDGITAEILKETVQIISPLLVHLINIIYKNGTWPNSLKLAVIKPLHKKGDKYIIENYRPISLTSTIAKVLEKSIKHRLVKYLEKFNLLSKKQFGFRQNTSTNDAIAYLTNEIYQSIDSSKPSVCVFIDLAKAFDTISHKRVLEKLRDFGVRGICHKLFSDYLTNRTQYVKIENFLSDPKTVLCGLPQGTVLAPIMFIIYLNDLLTLDIKGSIVSFADDTAIYFKGNSWDEVRQTVEVDLKVIKDWFDENLLTINIDKTS